MIFHIFFTIFFFFLTLEGSNDAENLFQATLFDEAIVQFSSSDDPKKMIQALFATENYRKINALAKGRFFDPDTNYLIGLSLEREGDFAEAIPYFANTCPIHWTRCLLLTNRFEETPLLTLLNLIEQERWREAKVLLDSQAIAGDSYHLLAALIAENEQDFLQALIHYQKVSASDVSGHIARCLEALTLNPILDALYAHHLQQQGKLQEAESAWHRLATKYPDNAIAPLAWIAAARLSPNPKQHYQTLYTLYPSSPYAPEAYFSSYSFQEYVEGDRNAHKHLRAMPTLFPNSPYTLFAFYLLGLDEKRDRKSDKNKWLAHRNLGNALKYFAEVEHRFEAIVIPEHLKESLEQLRNTTLFEKGLTHLANAEEATDPKATIQRGYARQCFQQIANQNEEALFWLAKTEYQLGNKEQAIHIIEQLTTNNHPIAASAWILLGQLLLSEHQPKQALAALDRGCTKETDPIAQLAVKIDKSECYKQLNQWNDAMLELSQVINAPVVSSLRVKAMYLRAELYQLQGRDLLARKQLEATAKKGGEWGAKASIRLNTDFH